MGMVAIVETGECIQTSWHNDYTACVDNQILSDLHTCTLLDKLDRNRDYN